MVLGNMSRGTVLGSVRGFIIVFGVYAKPYVCSDQRCSLVACSDGSNNGSSCLVVTFAYCAREFAAPTHGMMPTIFQPTKGACAVLRLVCTSSTAC